MNYINEQSCLKAENVSFTLKKVFEFIIQNQLGPSGYLAETTLLLKISLTDVQLPTTQDRTSVSNIVYGTITKITDTYVVLLAKRDCNNIYSEYTVEYNKIIYISNSNLYTKKAEFINYILSTTPKICSDKNSQYVDMLKSLSIVIEKYKASTIESLKLIFDGINSREAYENDISIVRNIVLFEKVFIFPITSISGYIVSPICISSNAISNEISNNLSTNNTTIDKGGVLNV